MCAIIDFEDLKNMSKNGEIGKKLLQNEEFKSKIKRVLCKEKIADNQVSEMIENFEKALKYGVPLSDEELENVSGGAPTKSEKIKTGVTLAGDVLGYALGQAFNIYLLNPKIENLSFVKKAKNGSYGTVSNFIISKQCPGLPFCLSHVLQLLLALRLGPERVMPFVGV